MSAMQFIDAEADAAGSGVHFFGPGEIEVGPGHEGVLLGLALPNDFDVEDIAADLDRFAVIALHFPKWVDGRAYSQARLLRSRFRFAGEIRATGDVVADMMPLLQRTGFSAVALRADQSRTVAERALAFFPEGHYQGDVKEHRPLFARTAAAA